MTESASSRAGRRRWRERWRWWLLWRELDKTTAVVDARKAERSPMWRSPMWVDVTRDLSRKRRERVRPHRPANQRVSHVISPACRPPHNNGGSDA